MCFPISISLVVLKKHHGKERSSFQVRKNNKYVYLYLEHHIFFSSQTIDSVSKFFHPKSWFGQSLLSQRTHKSFHHLCNSYAFNHYKTRKLHFTILSKQQKTWVPVQEEARILSHHLSMN